MLDFFSIRVCVEIIGEEVVRKILLLSCIVLLNSVHAGIPFDAHERVAALVNSEQ